MILFLASGFYFESDQLEIDDSFNQGGITANPFLAAVASNCCSKNQLQFKENEFLQQDISD